MPKRTITAVNELQAFLERVISRADDRAPDVNRVILVLASAVIWAKDGPIELADREGNLGNHLWFPARGRRYCLAYSHNTHSIQVRSGSREGRSTYEFTNSSTAAQIFQAFSSIKFGQRPDDANDER